jgi:GNAT superfamily N-acetyltransferase
MTEYRVRPATLDDADALVRHRVGMFTDMGYALDAPAHESAYRAWLAGTMPAGTFRAWVVEDAGRTIVGGGGLTVIPWPPGPQHPGGRVAFVYNVYTEPAHRRRGVARLIMNAIHDWCRQAGIGSIALNASGFGQPVYEAMGYQMAPSPMMVLTIDPR